MLRDGNPMTPKLIIHGGCGKFEGKHAKGIEYHSRLMPILEKSYARLLRKDAKTAVVFAMRLLEDEEIFNAGYGSKLQQDGAVRMSAAFMDGREGRFSAVINVENIRHPIDIARILNRRKHTVIAGAPAEAFARKEAIPPFNPIAPHRLREHLQRKAGETGTCGVVAMDSSGRICAGTSTGGIGYEVPGRVGDTPTVAGNYAGHSCGVSCTGIGEHIVNLAVASRVVTLVDSGRQLQETARHVVELGNGRKARFGMIALDASGEIVVAQTHGVTVLAAWADGASFGSFLSQPDRAGQT